MRPSVTINVVGEQMLVCRECQAMFFTSDPDRKYCDRHLVERVNGAGIFEDDDPDDLFPDRPAQLELLPTARITCRVCGMRSEVTVDNSALLCGPCRVDTEATRSHVESTLVAAERHWQETWEAFDVQAQQPEVAEAWAKIEEARLSADPALFAEAWRRRKAAGGPLADLLRAREALDDLGDELTRRRTWAAAALEEIKVYEATPPPPGQLREATKC